MTRTVIAVSLVIALGVVSWGASQGPQIVDLKNARQELEIMRGILQTTLSFVIRDMRQRETSAKTAEPQRRVFWSGGSDIDAFYLQGQGAVFVVSTSGLRVRISERADEYMLANEAMMEAQDKYAEAMATQQEVMRSLGGVYGGVASGVQGGVVGGVQAGTPPPPQPPKPPQPPQAVPATPAPAKQAAKEEEMRKKLAEAQEKVKQRQEELKARQKKYQEYLGEIKAHLVEALANHGDSLTIVKPGEYVNLIIGGDGFGGERWLPFGEESSSAAYQVISVQKSVITDYKAGRLTLDGFKQKVLQYQN